MTVDISLNVLKSNNSVDFFIVLRIIKVGKSLLSMSQKGGAKLCQLMRL